MNVKVVLLPRDLKPADVADRTVVVFDVLRATTTMTAALAAGVRQIFVFDSLQAAQTAAAKFDGPRILCGEQECLRPTGFDFGNSPRQWNASEHAGRTAFLATTNGTRAIVAAAPFAPANLFVGALVNAQAVARACAATGKDATLLCAGTAGEISLEDALGAGAVLHELLQISDRELIGDAAQIALRLFMQCRGDLEPAMTSGAGGQNLTRAGMPADIQFCAQLNIISTVGTVDASLCVTAL
jgi:2-phosphosulfolactate phosphatase